MYNKRARSLVSLLVISATGMRCSSRVVVAGLDGRRQRSRPERLVDDVAALDDHAHQARIVVACREKLVDLLQQLWRGSGVREQELTEHHPEHRFMVYPYRG